MANQFTTNIFSIVPIGNHTRLTPLTTATTLVLPTATGVTGVILQAEGQNVVYVLGASSPIAVNSGFLLKTTDNPVRLDLFPGAVIKLLEAAVGGAINYQFFRSV